jgi:hypothetical protein
MTTFTSSHWGEHSGDATGEARPRDDVEWDNPNGADNDLTRAIVGDDGACVHRITVAYVQPGGPYAYAVLVDAQGPNSIFGWLHLYFTDRTGDRYALGIFDSDRKEHRVDYNSDAPEIVKVEWGS